MNNEEEQEINDLCTSIGNEIDAILEEIERKMEQPSQDAA